MHETHVGPNQMVVVNRGTRAITLPGIATLQPGESLVFAAGVGVDKNGNPWNWTWRGNQNAGADPQDR